MTANGTGLVPLVEAGPGCGGKANALGALLRSGFPVPDGFVVTDPATDPREIDARLRRLRTRAVAVRSSGLAEDSGTASFAGQLETVLGARGLDEVLIAVRRCAASARAARALAYRTHLDLADEAGAPVIVQEFVKADRSGVLFTRDPRTGDDALIINASWGLGESIVSGAVSPDEFVVTPPSDAVHATIGAKQTRRDLGDHGLVRSHVPERDRSRPCLRSDEVAELVALGRRCEVLFGQPQDVEWAVRDGRIWILQSRPITTVDGPRSRAGRADPSPVLVTGVAASPGLAHGPARVLRSVDDFPGMRPGDVLVCRTTDPAWTPLFRMASGVVTETGGVLCHGAIVAREYGIPAVVGAHGAMTTLTDDAPTTVDGTRGVVTLRRFPDGSPVLA